MKVTHGYSKKRGFYKRKDKGSSKPPTCFHCGKPGHFKTECPKLQKKKHKYQGEKKKSKKKAFQAVWDETDSDSSEEEKDNKEEHVANMCFMAREDDAKVSYSSSCYSSDNDSDYDEDLDYDNWSREKLLEEFLCATERFEKIFKKYEKLKKKKSTHASSMSSTSINSTCNKCASLNAKVNELVVDKETLENEKQVLITKIEELEIGKKLMDSSLQEAKSSINSLNVELGEAKSKTLELEGALTKFTKGKDKLNVLLGEYSANPKRQGLGFNPNATTSNSNSTIFVKPLASTSSNGVRSSSFVKLTPQEKRNKHTFHTCSYCLTMGHTIKFCRIKKKNDAKYPYHFVPNINPLKKKHVPMSKQISTVLKNKLT